MKRVLATLFAFGLSIMAVPAKEKAPKPSEGTSHEFAYYTYIEESGPYKVMVYSYPAMWRQGSNYFPIVVAVGLAKSDKKVELRIADFLLIDEDGNTETPKDYKTVLKEYKEGEADQAFIRQFPMNVGNQFTAYDDIDATFYPSTDSPQLATDVVELDSTTYWTGVLYYPHDANGISGLLSLWLEGKDFQPPIQVKFRVPPARPRSEQKGHTAKDK